MTIPTGCSAGCKAPPFQSRGEKSGLTLARLTNSSHLQVLASLSALHCERPAELHSLLSDYQPQENRQGLCP
jgi:hypothetical protein